MSTAQYQEDDSISQFGTNSQGDEADQAPLNRRVGTVAGMTFLSRVSGLIRDVVFAYLFGASAAADLFFVAFRIPNFFVDCLPREHSTRPSCRCLCSIRQKAPPRCACSWVSSPACFPHPDCCRYCRYRHGRAAFALFAPGFLDQPQRFAQLTDLVRITFPIWADLVDGLRRGAAKRARQICPAAFTPVMLNVVLTLAALLALSGALNEEPIVILAWGVLVAGIVQWLMQLRPSCDCTCYRGLGLAPVTRAFVR